MKLRLLVKSLMMLLFVCVAFHLISMPHIGQPDSHGKMVAVENEVSLASTNLQEDQKHVDLLNKLQVKDQLFLTIVFISLLVFSSRKSRRKIKHFLYSVYYQSSYFSRNHLFTA